MTQKKWHYKSRRWDLFQFAYFTTNLYTSPPWQMREDRRLIFIPELWKRNLKKNSIDNLKKNWDLLPTPGLFPSFLHARGTFLPSFFVPTLGDLTTQESPPPGICYQAKKKLLMPGNQRGGWGLWLEGSWAQLELTDAWCNILMIHSISVVAIRTVWVLILNFVTHLL